MNDSTMYPTSGEQVPSVGMADTEYFNDLLNQSFKFDAVEDFDSAAFYLLNDDKPFDCQLQDILEDFPTPLVYKPYVIALLAFVDDFGCLDAPLLEIARECDLQLDELEWVRRKLCDGSVLGFCSFHSQEFRFQLMKHLIEKRTSGNASNQNVLASHRQRVMKIEQLPELQFEQLYYLAKELSCVGRIRGKLTAHKVKELINCDDESAELLCRAYTTLPSYPLV